jgi:hypothetical protein
MAENAISHYPNHLAYRFRCVTKLLRYSLIGQPMVDDRSCALRSLTQVPNSARKSVRSVTPAFDGLFCAGKLGSQLTAESANLPVQNLTIMVTPARNPSNFHQPNYTTNPYSIVTLS